jgi:hypothetical protein
VVQIEFMQSNYLIICYNLGGDTGCTVALIISYNLGADTGYTVAVATLWKE